MQKLEYLASHCSGDAIWWMFLDLLDWGGSVVHCTVCWCCCCYCFIVDGIIGMAIVGGAAAAAVGAIVGLGVALSRKK